MLTARKVDGLERHAKMDLSRFGIIIDSLYVISFVFDSALFVSIHHGPGRNMLHRTVVLCIAPTFVKVLFYGPNIAACMYKGM